MNSLLTLSPAQSRLLHAPADDATAAATAATADTAAASGQTEGGAQTQNAGATQAAAAAGDPWWKSPDISEEERQWLVARGLTEDDPLKAIPKMLKGHRAAEQRIGKGLDTIIDRPAKGEDYGEWARKNAAALGLPEKEDGYAIKKPDFWPKDEPWDEGLEKEARSFAFKHGLPPAAFQDFVNLYAQSMKRMLDGSKANGAAASEAMMADLTKDWGSQTNARITQAKQGLEYIAEQAGLSKELQSLALDAISEKTGDAAAIRLFQKVGELLGDDSMVRGGADGGFGMTPAEARAELARFTGPEGDYGKAYKKGDTKAMRELTPRRDFLAKIASSGG